MYVHSLRIVIIMSVIKLYIATTLDGFIARENNSLDWLHELPVPENEDYGYSKFLSGIDTVIMGRKTYDEILGFGVDWPYANCKSYILTSEVSYKATTPNTEVLHDLDLEFIEKVKTESKKNTWIVGGGQLISTFLNLDAIDEMILSIVPRILGKGIRLFPNGPKETKFELISSQSFESGLVNLTYRKEKA